jgi:hypothetical protein
MRRPADTPGIDRPLKAPALLPEEQFLNPADFR